MKAFIKTYGCQMNEQDSLHMKGLLSRMGYEFLAEPESADLILLTTCAVREKAVQKVYSDLGRIRLLAEGNPGLVIGVAGCVAQLEKENLHRRFPFVDLVFGPSAIRDLPDMVKTVLEHKKNRAKNRLLRTEYVGRKDFEFVNLMYTGEENRVRAFVNIQKGCDNVCSYCIVPHVRGPEVSRPKNEIIDEITTLTGLGVGEVILLGQNVNSYGIKDTGIPAFAGLLKEIAEKTQIKRLRFTSSHPKDVDSALVEQFKNLEILCPHFHLPVQSGSDKILSAMRRQYTRKDYLALVEQLKKARPGIAFSTDFIVGFPGEKDCDFEDTLNLLCEVGFDSSFSFVYSPRPRTTATHLDDNVPHGEKIRRLKILQDMQNHISFEKNKKLVESVEEVLVEGKNDSGDCWIGRTGTNKLVHCVSKIEEGENSRHDDLTGRLIRVKITKAAPQAFWGEVL